MSFLIVDDEITLKLLEDEDTALLFSLVDKNRSYLREWLPWVDTNTTIEESRLFIKTSTEQYEQNLGFQCGIRYHDRLVGVIGFHRIDWMNRNVEIGYWLGAEFQGLGIITKACRTMIDFAFYEYQLHRVQIRCAVGNTKSCAIIKRLNFVNEGITRQAEFLYDHYVDLCIYSMIAEDWKAIYGTKEAKWH
jgi:ribosomal-protein-serine acetyltransferase